MPTNPRPPTPDHHPAPNPRPPTPAVVLALVLVSGCAGEHHQSVLHPAGPAASQIAWLWWFMCIVFTVVLLVVTALLLVAVFRSPGDRDESASPPLGSTPFIVLGGIVMPTVLLVVLLFVSLDASTALRVPDSALTVRVTGHQWWWEVDYPEQDIRDANEIYIPVGEPVRVELTSADVIHSFWVPNLNGKMDMIPGQWNRFWLQADRPGTYRGQCAEYCGLQHARMALLVVALPPEEFQAWVSARQRPVEPDLEREPVLRQGREVFFRAGCQNCHAIRGTEADGRIGPDLTHIASRKTLGAGTLTNTRGNLAGWVVNPQALKPGNLMPRSYLEPSELHALLDYLSEQLEAMSNEQ